MKIETGKGPLIGGAARGTEIESLSLVFDEDSIVIKGNIAFGVSKDDLETAKELENLCRRAIDELENRRPNGSKSSYTTNTRSREFSGYLKLTGGQDDASRARALAHFFSDMTDPEKGEVAPERPTNPLFGKAFD